MKKIYILFLFSLPFNLLPFLHILRNLFSESASFDNSLIIFLFGMILIIIKGDLKTQSSKMLLHTFILISYLSLSTFIMSAVLYNDFGTLYNENTFTASFSSYFYLFLLFLVFYFNSYMSKFLTTRTLDKLMTVLTAVILLVGYLQILVLFHFPFSSNIYDFIDFFDILNDSSYILSINRIPLVGREPASVGIVVGCFISPYLLSKSLEKKQNRKFILLEILFLPLVFFTYSTTAYISLLINVVIFAYFYFKYKNHSKKSIFMLLSLATSIIFIVISSLVFKLSSELFNTIYDYLIVKPFNFSNMSTGYRYTTVINSIEIFKKFPFFGVGSGNQGFFYNYNVLNSSMISSNIVNSSSTLDALNGKFGLIGGGAFWPDYISSYGVFGLLMLIWYAHETKKSIINNSTLKHYKYFYFIAVITFLFLALASASIYGKFIIMFIFSIPLMHFQKKIEHN